MKTGEMYNTALAQPKATFKKGNNGNIYFFEEGQLMVKDARNRNLTYPANTPKPNEDWELVREPVDFMTAIKAYDAGKVIEVRMNDVDTTYENGHTLRDNHEQPLTTDEILNGKWFIED